MNAYWQLTLAQLKIFIRNRQVLFWSLLFPLFFMVMFGSFFGNGTSVSINGLVVDHDQTEASRLFIAAFGQQPAFSLETAENEADAMERLKRGDRHIVIVIPRGYEEKLNRWTENADSGNKEPVRIKVYYDQTNVTASQTALAIVNLIADGISKQIVRYTPVMTVEQEGVQSLNLKYIDFLVPGIVAMMIMSNNLNGVAAQIASWRERGVLRRMQSTTLKASTFIASQITARLLLNGLQAVIVLVVARFVFGTQVNGSWFTLLLFVVLGTLAFMAIGFIIAGLARTPESAGPIAGFLSFPMLFLGGVFFPIQNIPEFLQPLVRLLPISHLTTALRQVMNVGAGMTEMWPEALNLGGWLIAAFIVSAFTFKWE